MWGHFLCLSEESRGRWPKCIKDEEPWLQSGWGSPLPAPCCREQGEVPSGWTQHPGPQLVAQFPGATCYSQVWGSGDCRQHPHARSLWNSATPPLSGRGTQAEGTHRREEAGGLPNQGQRTPAHPQVRGHLQRAERPSLTLMLASRAPQLQPSWSSPEPSQPPTQPINWAASAD